ncbi:MAG: helix-turn-helix transcriptional regulator [Rhodospirillaceae bacterium]
MDEKQLVDPKVFRDAREGAGFKTLGELSAAADVAIGALSEIETGKAKDMRVSTAFKIAKATGRDLGSFFPPAIQETEAGDTPAAS